MSCNISIPLQRIIDDVADTLAGQYISVDNPFLNEAVLTDTTLRGDLTLDTEARDALCTIITTCSITAAELEWLAQPTGANLVAISSLDGSEVVTTWKDIVGVITTVLEENPVAIAAGDVIVSDGVSQEDLNSDFSSDIKSQKLDTGITATAKFGGVERTQADKNSDVVSIKDFGAKCDGVTDDTQAIQACVDAVGSNAVIKFPSNQTTVVTSSIEVLNDNVELELGTCVIDAKNFSKSWQIATDSIWNSGRNRAVFEYRGSYVGKFDLADSHDKHSDYIEIDNADAVTVGDLVYLTSTEHWYTSGEMRLKQQELNYVVDIFGNTVKFAHPLSNSYPSGSTAEIVKPVKLPKISGGVFLGPAVAEELNNGFGLCAISLEGASQAQVNAKSIKGFQNRAVAHNWTYDIDVSGITIQGHEWEYSDEIIEDKNSGFYGVFGKVSRFCRITNLTGLRVRHLADGMSVFDCTVSNCLALKSHKSSYTSHEASQNWTFINCIDLSATDTSLYWRGFDLNIKNCDFSATSNSGQYSFYDAIGAADDMPRAYSIVDSKFSASRNAIYLQASKYRSVKLSKGSVEGGLVSGYPTILASADSIKNFVCNDVDIYANNNNTAIRFTKLSDNDSVIIDGGTVDGFKNSVVDFSNSSELNIVAKCNNLILNPTNVSYHIITYTNKNNGITDTSNNYHNGSIVGGGLLFSNTNDSNNLALSWYETSKNDANLKLLVGGSESDAVIAAKHIRWTRIGNVISFNAYIALTSKPSEVGDITISTGIPHKAYSSHAFAISLSQTESSVRAFPFSASMSSSNTDIRMQVADGSSTLTRALKTTDITDNTIVNISGSYVVL